MSQPNKSRPTIGRFAPSPTGPLHFGSLVSALASYLHCRSQQGQWLVRIEDIDETRARKGAASHILASLEILGLLWDKPVIVQSERKTLYEDYLNQLKSQNLVYACNCTRRRLQTLHGHYDGFCRKLTSSPEPPVALRIKTDNQMRPFRDQVFSAQTAAVDDFILKRKDGFFAYQLVVVIDDIEQGVTEVVRGCDLLDSTARQIHLFECFNHEPPSWLHLPLVADTKAQKLSKQNHAEALNLDEPSALIIAALELLKQNTEGFQEGMAVEEVLGEAIKRWSHQNIPASTYYQPSV